MDENYEIKIFQYPNNDPNCHYSDESIIKSGHFKEMFKVGNKKTIVLKVFRHHENKHKSLLRITVPEGILFTSVCLNDLDFFDYYNKALSIINKHIDFLIKTKQFTT